MNEPAAIHWNVMPRWKAQGGTWLLYCNFLVGDIPGTAKGFIANLNKPELSLTAALEMTADLVAQIAREYGPDVARYVQDHIPPIPLP